MFSTGAPASSPAAKGSAVSPVRFACVYFSNGVERQTGRREAKGPDGYRPWLEADEAFPRGHGLPQGPVQRAGAAQEPPHRTHGQHALRRWVSTDRGRSAPAGRWTRSSRGASRRTALPSLVLASSRPSSTRGRPLDDYGSSSHGAATRSPRPRRSTGGSSTCSSVSRRPPPRPHDPRRGARRRPRPGPAGEQADRRKLDEYLESVRDIERRIERASDDGRLEAAGPRIAAPALAPRGRLPRTSRTTCG